MSDTAASTHPDVNTSAVNDRERTTFLGFLIPVVLFAAAGAGALVMYDQHEKREKEINQHLISARNKLKKHDFASLLEAEKLYQKVIDLDASNAVAQASMALTLVHQAEHGADTVGKAKQFLEQARQQDVETPDRYAAEAFVMIQEGKPAAAETMIRDLLNRGMGNPRTVHALAVALGEQGKYLEANRVLRQAKESDFSAVALDLSLAEIASRQGEFRAAVKDLGSVVRDNMNPNHQLAKAWRAALLLREVGSLTSPLQLIKDVREAKVKGPKTEGYLAWAEGELALAVGNGQGALDKAKAAEKSLKSYPMLYDLEARAYLAMKQPKEALAAYEKAAAAKPEYRSMKWKVAELKSLEKDDSALTIIDELEKSHEGSKGPQYALFRGQHLLRQGKLEEAKKQFEAAADRGNDAKILLGLAQVTFEEEKAKGKKADIQNVSTALETALTQKNVFPEAHELLGDVSLWNYMVPAADSAYQTAERQLKQLKRPTPELVAFYDRVIANFEGAERQVQREAKKAAEAWKERKKTYLASLLTSK